MRSENRISTASLFCTDRESFYRDDRRRKPAYGAGQ